MPEPFTARDGDGWYARNEYALMEWIAADDLPLRLLSMYRIAPTVAVEVGCASGYRLEALREMWTPPTKRLIGVDISEAAIADGRKRYPQLELHVASAEALPIESGIADVVIVYFVLHWISREMLPLVEHEIDRVLKVGGVLVGGDFSPTHFEETVPYKHRDGVFTYKQVGGYMADFWRTGRYCDVASLSFNHDTHALTPDVPSEQRAAVWLLRKER